MLLSQTQKYQLLKSDITEGLKQVLDLVSLTDLGHGLVKTADSGKMPDLALAVDNLKQSVDSIVELAKQENEHYY
jgi:hypothetical protein